MFGDDHLASFDLVLNILEERMDTDDVQDHYDTAGTSEGDLITAYHAADWLAGNDDEFDPVENWPLVKEN